MLVSQLKRQRTNKGDVDPEVELAQFGLDSGRRSLHRLVIRHINRERKCALAAGADVGGCAVEPGTTAGQDRDVVAAGGELADGGTTHPGRPARHHGNLSSLRHRLAPLRDPDRR
jgi:hypothetical protein